MQNIVVISISSLITLTDIPCQLPRGFDALLKTAIAAFLDHMKDNNSNSSHYTGQHVGTPVKSWMILLKQSFTAITVASCDL